MNVGGELRVDHSGIRLCLRQRRKLVERAAPVLRSGKLTLGHFVVKVRKIDIQRLRTREFPPRGKPIQRQVILDQIMVKCGNVRGGRPLPDAQHMLDALEHLIVLLHGQIRFRAGSLRVQPCGGGRIVAELFRALEDTVLLRHHLHLRGELAELFGGRDGAHVLQRCRPAGLQRRVDHRSALGKPHVDGAVFASGIDAGKSVADVRALWQGVFRPASKRVLRAGELRARRFHRDGAIFVEQGVGHVAARPVKVAVLSQRQRRV